MSDQQDPNPPTCAEVHLLDGTVVHMTLEEFLVYCMEHGIPIRVKRPRRG